MTFERPKIDWSGKHLGLRRRAVLLCFGLGLAATALYWPVLKHEFINFDDPDYVTLNPHTQAGLTAASVRWAFTSCSASNWHPLTWLSHMADCQLYGLRPAGHHLTNLGLHLANTLLLFVLFQRMTRKPWRSALVAALFALHPLHVESVAWVAERKDVLCAFFGLLTLYVYARWAEGFKDRRPGPGISTIGMGTGDLTPSRSRRWLFYALALLFFGCGLMSKPMLVTWPCVMLLLDYWPLGRWGLSGLSFQWPKLGWLVLEKIPFFALTAASSIVTFIAQKSGGSVVGLSVNPLADRLINAAAAYGRYFGKTFWPTGLTPFYPYERLEWVSWPVLWGLLVLMGVTSLVLIRARTKPYLFVGWFWFIGTLVPVIGLVQVGDQALADRYTYLPLIGLFLSVIWSASEWWGCAQRPRAVALLAIGLPLTACFGLTTLQLRYWRDTKTLFQHAVAVSPDNYVAHAVLGEELANEGRLQEALQACLTALQISPRYVEAHQTLASVLQRQGKDDEAIEECRRTLELSPRHAEAYDLLGSILEKQGKYDEAISNFRQALAINPDYLDSYDRLGDTLIKKRAYAEAEVPSRAALKLAPGHLPAMYCLATALHHQAKYDEAIQWYQRLIGLAPTLFTPHRHLANVFLAQAKTSEALAELNAALKLRPNDVDTQIALGLLLLQHGQEDEAQARFAESLQLDPSNVVANSQLAVLHQKRKELHEAIACYRRALNTESNSPELLNNLAWILAASPDPAVRNGAEAVVLAEQACRLTDYKEAVFVGTLAAAYASVGKFNDAVKAAEKARTLAVAAKQESVAQRNQQLLELYRAGQAYHEPE